MQQFKRSFWQLLFFLTLALSLINLAFIKRSNFQSSLVVTTVTTAKVWGYNAPYAHKNLPAFKNDEAVKGVFSILNKLFSDKKTAVSLFIHQFLLNEANLAKSRFHKTFSYTVRGGEADKYFLISNSARTVGLWSAEGERALMDSNFKLSSLGDTQKGQNWLAWLRNLVRTTAIFDSDYAKDVQGPFNLEETRKNIRNLFVGLAIEEMKIQLKDNQGLFVENLNVLWEEMKVQLKGEQGNKGVQGVQGLGTPGNKGEQGLRGAQGLGTQGDQGLRGPAGQNGQVKKEVVIGLSIALGVFFCFFLACVIYQKRIFSTFKNPKKSTKI